MSGESIEQWEHSQAELEIRRWLYTVGLWAPGAENLGRKSLAESSTPGSLSQEQIDQLLRSETVGRLGCHADGKTYIVPIVYAYDGECVYAHSGEGVKLRMMRANPAVCFEVEHIDSMTKWQSVIAWGRFEELHGEAAARPLRLLAERTKPLLAAHMREAQPADADVEGELAALDQERPSVYRIVLGERSGRYDNR